MTIREECFLGFDLNLMVVFLTVYQHRSVSKAAMNLKVGQPAVSGSLARLRSKFDDPLFVREGRGMMPTAKANQLAVQLLPAMRLIERVISPGDSNC
ncbi:MAG: LysR family transcriptional regulator [Pseudomonas sp.]